MSNHLKNETSPYLLQHAENPVNWYPWCREAFEKARKEDKPIFLSIGYSTCHWCHVMAHESFEDGVTADILNRHFISIKVDREERPDIDSVYMAVCQAFTGSGGWPMSIFMNWDKKPFFAGTYFPVQSQYGMPGFADLLNAVAHQWNSNRNKLLHSADQIITHLQQSEAAHRTGSNETLSEKAVQMFSALFDSTYGGFGTAPKFPSPHNLFFLTLYAKQNNNADVLKMVEKTLTQMRKGGIFDHIGYGFSRYSTDQYFLAPHFEKMLYDNALLIIAYASVYMITQNHLYLDTAEQTAQYVIREMTAPHGGFYSAQDADSEGVEGKYYTFSFAEIMNILGEEKGRQFSHVFDITAKGNFEGVNIPNLLKSNALNSDFSHEIQKLYEYRKNRHELHLDDKILTSWNSMMIAALSILYRVSRNEKYLQTAIHAQIFIETNLSKDLELCTSWRSGKHSESGFLDDYAFYIAALIELYHSTLNRDYLKKAERFCKEAVKRFADDEPGGFYLSDSDSTELFMNPKESYDGAIPSGNSIMTYNLVRLYQLTEKEDYRELAERQIHYMSAQAQDYLTGHSMFLFAKMLYDNPPEHITIVLKNSTDLENIKKQLPLLANAIVVSESKEYPLVNDSTTFYVCKNHTCFSPTNTLEFFCHKLLR
ncbi:MAG: thioredoxin domain-containing protein [Lachnospiraceae bacterium]|nr:thioredoxin domain-containing protein [Lachnospiraceae bacterium]